MCVSLCFVLNVKMAMAVRNVFWVMLPKEKNKGSISTTVVDEGHSRFLVCYNGRSWQ